MAHMTKVTADYSHRSTVVVCECGWRDVALTRGAALTAAAAHVRKGHADDKAAEKLRERVAALKPGWSRAQG